jgi:hypothetical protein
MTEQAASTRKLWRILHIAENCHDFDILRERADLVI